MTNCQWYFQAGKSTVSAEWEILKPDDDSRISKHVVKRLV